MKLNHIGILVIVLSLGGIAFAHGWVADPPARQYICSEQGGQWWPADGSGIPNEACREAYLLKREPLLYTQVNEYAANVLDFNSQSAIEQEVPNGLLCSAGRENYSGMSLSHPAWQRTTVKGGKYTLKFAATAPHNPSFWKIYISKPEFDPDTQTLGWNDLELLNEFANIPVNAATSPGSYEMEIDLPQGRKQGNKAILFTRWQRVDNAGEGFYNCSDVVFGEDNAPVPPSQLPPTIPTPPDKPTEPGNANEVDVLFTIQDSWDSGFTGIILIANKSESPLDDWRFSFKLASTASTNETIWGAGGGIEVDDSGLITISPNLLGSASIQPGTMTTIFYGGLGRFTGADSCSFNEKDCLVQQVASTEEQE